MRWGILGCGDIAAKTVQAGQRLPEVRFVAAASRSAEKAQAFAQQHGIDRAHGSYDTLLADPGLEGVYVATPHPHHAEWTIAALAAGKHVLCEKPLAVNAPDAQAMIDAAGQSGRLLAEALWQQYTPGAREIHRLVPAGAIGEPHLLQINTSFRVPFHPAGRLFDPQLAGGGLLDIGVYGVAWAVALFGEPTHVQSLARLGETGVDEHCVIQLGFANGALAQLTAGVRTMTRHAMALYGSDGQIHVEPPFGRATRYELRRADGAVIQHDHTNQPHDRSPMLEAVDQAVAAGRHTCEAFPLAASLATARTMDQCRAQWGLSYSFEAR